MEVKIISAIEARKALEVISGFFDGYLDENVDGYKDIEAAESLLYKFISQQGDK